MVTTTQRDGVEGARRLALRAWRFELGTWRSLARWLARRPAVAKDGVALGYRGPMVLPITVFLVLSTLEVVVVDVAVPWPWAWLRFLVLGAGVWGAVLMLGMLAAVSVYPHVVEPAGVRVRHGATFELFLPRDAIATARAVRGTRDGRSVQVVGECLYVVATSQYAVELALTRPVPVRLPRGGVAEVTAVRLHADDPGALLAAVRAT